MSAYYALRLYQRTMHNRKPDGIASREIGLRDGLVLAPLVLCILGLALYPQLILHRTDRRGAADRRRRSTGGSSPGSAAGQAMNFHAPHIDYAGLSPVIALTAGLCVVLLSAVFKPLRRTRAGWLTLAILAVTAGLLIWQWGDPTDLVSGALRLDDLAIAISLIAILTAAFAVLLSIREPAAEEAGSGEYHALLLGSVLGMVLLAQAQNLVTFFVAIETLSIPLYILCATNLRRERSLESGLKYLIVGSLGSATLLYGMAFLYGGSGSTDFAGIAAGIGHERPARRPAGPGRDRDGRGRARLQDLDRPLPPVDARRLPGRADPDHRLHGGGDQGGGLRRLRPLLRRRPRRRRRATGSRPLAVLAAISIVVGNVGALGQDSLKRMLGYSGIAQAGYMLGGLVVASRGRRQRARLLPRRLRLHEPRRLRGDRRPRARDRLRRRHPRGPGPRRASGRCSPGR